MSQDFVVDPVAIRELQLIDASMNDVDTEITAKQFMLEKDILAARQQTINKIPAFWAIVFEHASSELECAITGADLNLFTKALTAVEIDRPEIPANAHPSHIGLAHFGEPRSVTIRFHFKPNDVIADSVLEKTFYYRYGKDGSAGLVSDPVRVNWKSPEMDLTEGLTEAAYAFWVAQKTNPAQQLDAVLVGDARKARDVAAKQMPEYQALKEKLDAANAGTGVGVISFFNFFSYRGRWTSAAESVEAKAELQAKRQAAMNGADPDDDDEPDEEFPEEEIETFPAGHEVAVAIAEDIFPGAIDYFLADTIDSDDEIDGIEVDDSDDDDDMEM